MNTAWIDALNPTLRRALDGAAWDRIERTRDGRWLGMPAGAPSDTAPWHELDLETGGSRPLLPLEDVTLKGFSTAVSRALHAGARVTLLAHKVARRAVLRVDGAASSRLVKVYRKDRSLLPRWNSVGEIADPTWTTPRVIAWDPEHRILETEWCLGRSLNQRWKSGSIEETDPAHIVGVLEFLNARRPNDSLPEWHTRDEVDILRRRLVEFEEVLEFPPPEAKQTVDRVTRALAELPESQCYCHRDFHDKQILVADRGPGGSLIDLDLVARGPRGLDAGNMIAHLRLRALQGLELPWTQMVQEIASARSQEGNAATLTTWTAATLTRLALLYCRRRHAPDLPSRLLDSANAALQRTGEWSGVLP